MLFSGDNIYKEFMHSSIIIVWNMFYEGWFSAALFFFFLTKCRYWQTWHWKISLIVFLTFRIFPLKYFHKFIIMPLRFWPLFKEKRKRKNYIEHIIKYKKATADFSSAPMYDSNTNTSICILLTCQLRSLHVAL